MKEEYVKSTYPSKNLKTEAYKENNSFFTKLYHDSKIGYVKELSILKDGIKEVKHFTVNGILSKLEYFVDDKREGTQTSYFIPKANKSVKSSKKYHEGKLHGECLTYNSVDEIIKQEFYTNGILVLKYLRSDSASKDITSIEIVDKENIDKLPKIEYDKVQSDIEKNPEFFLP